MFFSLAIWQRGNTNRNWKHSTKHSRSHSSLHVNSRITPRAKGNMESTTCFVRTRSVVDMQVHRCRHQKQDTGGKDVVLRWGGVHITKKHCRPCPCTKNNSWIAGIAGHTTRAMCTQRGNSRRNCLAVKNGSRKIKDRSRRRQLRDPLIVRHCGGWKRRAWEQYVRRFLSTRQMAQHVSTDPYQLQPVKEVTSGRSHSWWPDRSVWLQR